MVIIGAGYGSITSSRSVLVIGGKPELLRNVIMSIRQIGVPIGYSLPDTGSGSYAAAFLTAGCWTLAAALLLLKRIPGSVARA